jgi:hypothetical protein
LIPSLGNAVPARHRAGRRSCFVVGDANFCATSRLLLT